MMRIPIAFGAIVLCLFATPTLSQSVLEKSGINALVGASPSSADFVKEAAIGGMFETESSELAAIRAPDEATRAFAAKMNEDHQKAASELSVIVNGRQSELPMPPKPDEKHQAMIDTLSSLRGDDFTKQYRNDQIAAHKDATALLKRYADGGKDDKLKAWAAKTLPIFQSHLDMAQALK